MLSWFIEIFPESANLNKATQKHNYIYQYIRLPSLLFFNIICHLIIKSLLYKLGKQMSYYDQYKTGAFPVTVTVTLSDRFNTYAKLSNFKIYQKLSSFQAREFSSNDYCPESVFVGLLVGRLWFNLVTQSNLMIQQLFRSVLLSVRQVWTIVYI